MILLSVNGAILAYNMTMEDEMAKKETYDAHVYVEDRREGPLRVRMYTDEHSEVCSIQFGNSFTLNVVSPQDLIEFAIELDKFAKRAYDLHYDDDGMGDEKGPNPEYSSWSQIQKKLEDAGVVGLDLPYDPEDEVARTMAKEAVSDPAWNPNDPVNW